MSNESAPTSIRRAAFIGGSGFSNGLENAFGVAGRVTEVQTNFGAVSATVFNIAHNQDVIFLSRHGTGHSVPPHLINHRANIAALQALGVSHIFATSAVGSLRRELDSGMIVVLDDFVDLRAGITTFYDAISKVRHTDFSEPFSEELRRIVLEESSGLNIEWMQPPIVYPAGTYLCLSGPRYETPAEVRLFGSWGLDVVGMTVAAEAILARELDIPYVNIALVTNLGTGLSSSALSHIDVEAEVAGSRPYIIELLTRSLRRVLAT